MLMKIIRLLIFTCLCLNYTSYALPVESKPLNNNPESWNLYFVPRDPLNPSAEALIGIDPHIKKSKITPKSIFIAPNKNLDQTICPNGYRIDDYGKCIKTVTVNQDDILVSRLAELFGEDNSNKATISDSDYYDMFEEEKNNENAGPLQFNIPLMVDVDDGKKKMEYIIEEKVITMRNLPPPQKQVAAPITTEKIIVENSELIKPDEFTTTENLPKTTTEIEETTTEVPTTTTESTTTTTTTTTTQAPLPPTLLPYKLNNVEYVPKFTRKSNRTRVKSRTRRPRPTLLSSTSSSSVVVQKPSQSLQPPKRTRLRSGSKRRKTTVTTTTTTEVPVTHKPFYWLPKGWTIDETKKDKPVLIRFWADEPQQKSSYDERARSHGSRSQRMNSKKPSEEFFKEVTVPELEEILYPK